MGNNVVSSLASLSKEEISEAVAACGAKYRPYADAVLDNGVDGEILASLDSEEELIEIFDELEITSKLHRKVLTKALVHAKERSPRAEQEATPEESSNVIKSIPEFFAAAAVYDLNIETPDEEVKQFDQIVEDVLTANPKAQFAAVNLILEDAQHPISARCRKPDGSTYSDRRVAHLPHEDSVCYYLVHDPSKDILIKDLPEGNPFGPTYVGHVIKDRDGKRVGVLCQVADLADEEDTNEQVQLLQRLASIAEHTLEERRTLQARARSLEAQLADYTDDEIVPPGHGPSKAVTAAQVCDVTPDGYYSPEEVKTIGSHCSSFVEEIKASDSPRDSFAAAAVYDLNIETPDEEVEEFDQIVQDVLTANPKAQFAAVNLILEDAQHPISARCRKPDGSTYSDRRVAHLPHEDSVCYYLVIDPSKDVLIKDLPEGNPFGPTYVGHVLKDRDGKRVGVLCQVADLADEEDTNEQVQLLQRLASIAEHNLEDRRTLQARARSLKAQLAGYTDDEIVLAGHGPIKAVTVAQVLEAPPNDYPSPEEVKASGSHRNSSTLAVFRRNLAAEDDRKHLPLNFFDAVDAAGMPRPPIAKNDMERVAAVEAFGLQRMDPDGPVADSLRNLIATAAQIFRMPLAQISYHNHAKEFAFCPFSSGLTERQKAQCEEFVEEILIRDSKGAPFLGQRGRGNAVCNYPILSKRIFVVHDLWEDKAFTMYRDLQFIRSYVGCPIISTAGDVVAMLCMFDFKPRPDFDKAHELQAENIAHIISQTIENWALRQDIQRLEEERRLLSKRVDTDKRVPPTGEVTFVFTDVQNSTLLWEQSASAMEEALKIHDAIMRKCCADACGYEITTEGDAFLEAFHDPVDAISFALRVQLELYRAPWPAALLDLSQAADDPQNALRGLRVRMGIHHGPVTTTDHEVTGRIRYTGQTVRLAKNVEAMCYGGQIVVTVDAWRVASPLFESLGSMQVLDLGEHVLMTGTCMNDGIISKRLLQLVPSELSYDYSKARRGLVPLEEQVEAENGIMSVTGRQFPPPMTKRRLSPSFHEAPYADGVVTIAFVHSPGLESLCDEVAAATLAILGKMLRPLLLKTKGYECKEDRGIWMIAFEAPSAAVQFGRLLMTAVHSAVALDDSVDRKNLVKVGVVTDGFRSMEPNPTTGRADYYGCVVNRAARVAAAAGPGEVYLGVAITDPELLTARPPSLGPSILTRSKGIKTLKGVTVPMELYLCV